MRSKLSALGRPAGTAWGKGLSFLPAAAWYAVIYRFSAQTGWESGTISDAIVDKSIGLLGAMGEGLRNFDTLELLAFLLRKGAHMGVFFVLTGLLAWALWRAGAAKPLPRWAVTLGLCALLAGLDEVHQLYVPGRDGRVKDALIDLAGGVIFLLLWLLAKGQARRRNRTR